MNKFLILFTLLLWGKFGAIAQTSQKVLVMELTDGRIFTYALKEKPELSVKGKSIIISSSTVSAEYARADISEFRFDDIANSVRVIKTNEVEIVEMSGDRLTLNAKDNDISIQVFDINGQESHLSATKSNDMISIDLGTCAKGTYIIKINNKQSFKFIKR